MKGGDAEVIILFTLVGMMIGALITVILIGHSENKLFNENQELKQSMIKMSCMPYLQVYYLNDNLQKERIQIIYSDTQCKVQVRQYFIKELGNESKLLEVIE